MKRIFYYLVLICSTLFFSHTVWADCTAVEDPPGSGTYVISADCQFSNNAAGVDAGSGLQNSAFLKISNAVLTLGNTQTLSVGSFRVESGGAINIPKGGNIQVGKPLWVAVIDQDGDGYYNASSGTDPEVSATQPTGKVRKNVWAANGTDCNDNSSNVVNANMVWRTLFGAPCLDNDSDQYGSILTGKTCAGGTGDLSAVSNSVYTNIAWLSTPDTNDVTNYGAGNLRTSCLGEDCDDEDPEHNVTCCLPKDADCTLDSQCCGTKCCNGKCGSSCCWSADGTNCDGGCTSSSVASATVYTGCSQGSLCSGTNCWKYGGSCNAGCTGSGYTSDTVNTACRAHAVSRCGYSASCATNANQNPSINDGEDPVTAYELTGSCAQGSGNCYIVSGTNYTNHYTASALCPSGYHACTPRDCTYNAVNKWAAVNACTWTAAAYPYTVSSAVTKYTGSGTCSGTGSGTCYKLTGGTSYYTGNGASCPTGGSCPTGTYYDSTQCTYIPQ